ncbi:MAG: glycine cleavage system protein H [Pseudomonadota bacterium]
MSVKFSKYGYWLRRSDQGVRVGLTPQHVAQLGSVVFAEPPPVGKTVRRGDAHGILETTKAVTDLTMPVSGVITVVNAEISYDPARISDDPTGFGWLFEIEPSEREELFELLDAPVGS